MAKLTANELRNGTIFVYKNDPWVVEKYEHIKRGRGSATIKLKIRNVKSGELVASSYDQNQVFEEADVVKVSGQYLYKDDSNAYFMNSADYEQYSISLGVVKDQLQWLSEGGKVNMVIFEGDLVSIEVPKSVVLKVIYAEPGVKGDTSSGATKTVKLETGAEIAVPLFIKTGDALKINTDTGTYVNRSTN